MSLDSQTKVLVAEKVIRTTTNLLKKPVFEKGKADWISELPFVIRKYNNIIHHSIKMTPVQASERPTDKEIYSNLQDKREKQTSNFNLNQLFRTGDIKKVFSKEIVQTIAIKYTQ